MAEQCQWKTTVAEWQSCCGGGCCYVAIIISTQVKTSSILDRERGWFNKIIIWKRRKCSSIESVSNIWFWNNMIIMLPTFGVIFLQYFQSMFNQCHGWKYSSIYHRLLRDMFVCLHCRILIVNNVNIFAHSRGIVNIFTPGKKV